MNIVIYSLIFLHNLPKHGHLVLGPMIWKKNHSSQGCPRPIRSKCLSGLSHGNYWKFSRVFSHEAKVKNSLESSFLIMAELLHSLVFTSHFWLPIHHYSHVWHCQDFSGRGLGWLYLVLTVPLFLREMDESGKHRWEFLQKLINSNK